MSALSYQNIAFLEKKNGVRRDYVNLDASFLAASDGETVHLSKNIASILEKFQLQRTVPIWMRIISAVFDDDAEGLDEYLPSARETSSALPLIKLFAAGSGWSGSSAVFDYFSDNSQVSHVPGEFMHINGTFGLNGLLFGNAENFSLNTQFKAGPISNEELRNALRYCFLGLTTCESQTQTKHAKYAKYFVINGGVDYARAVASFIGQTLKSGMSRDHVSRIAEGFIDDCCRSVIGTKAEFVALDNVLPAYRLGMLEFLKNSKVFVVFRDPRDQFADNCLHNKRFHGSAKKFSHRYGVVREYINDVKKLEFGERVFVVQFEDLVLSESARSKVLQAAGISEESGMYERFVPSESAKNIGLFKDDAFGNDVAVIEEHLHDWLYVPQV